MANQYGNTTVFQGRDFYFHDIKYSIDEIIKYYIEENHSKIETSEFFHISAGTLTRLFKHYGVRKSKILSYEHNKKTNLARYGDPNYNNPEQYKKTCLEKYGVDNIFKDTQFMRQAYLDKLGVSNPNKLPEVVAKREQTNIERYGVKEITLLKECQEKIKQNNIKKYGVPYQMQRPEVRAKYDFKKNSEKAFQTKLKNGTTNTSQPEKDLYDFLIKIFGEEDIISQYKNQLYPYHCDFYIKSLDMYIELNLYFTHGGHPFDKNNLKDLEKLNKWKLKAEHEQSAFYKNAINVWTVSDVEKLSVAKKYNLNYITIYNMKQYEEFKNYIERSNKKC